MKNVLSFIGVYTLSFVHILLINLSPLMGICFLIGVCAIGYLAYMLMESYRYKTN